MHPEMMTAEEKLERLRKEVAGRGSLVVGLSSGVDSALLAAVAKQELGNAALAVTAVSPAVARRDIELASKTAAEIGIEHLLIGTGEVDREDYARNDALRCYSCRSELSEALISVARQRSIRTVAMGINLSDFQDYRPGIRAARERGVWFPLAECSFTKQDVRQAASLLGLSASDRASNACLSSRVQYGQRIDVETLKRVEGAEELLHSIGFSDCRVRVHGPVARIEVPSDSIGRFMDASVRASVISGLKELGFLYVTIDLEGLRSGSMNLMLRNSR